MKRLIALLLVLLMMVTLCACGRKAQSSDAGNNNGASPASNTTASSKDEDYKIDQVFFRTFQGTDGEHFQGSFRVTNTGKTPLFLGAAFWELKDSSGKTITTSSQQPGTFASPTVIDVGETSWYYINALVERMTDGSGDIADAVPIYQIPPHTPGNIDFRLFQVSDLTLQEKDGRIVASGTVDNNSDLSSPVLIYVNLFDKDGHLVGQLVDESLSIGAGDKMSFTAEGDTRKNSGELALALSDIASFDAVAFYTINK